MSDSNHKFHIDLPKGWSDQSLFTFTGPEDKGLPHQFFLLIDKNVGEVDLDQYAKERIDAVVQQDPTIEILKRERETLPNGREVVDFVCRTAPGGENLVYRRLVYMIVGEAGYTFTATFNRKTIKTLGVEVMNMINSFQPAE